MPIISPTAISPHFQQKKSLSSYLTTRNAYFALPDTGIFLIVGQEITIFGESLINMPIGNPLVVEYTCDIGSASGNGFTINPAAGDVGEHSLTVVFKNGSYTIATETITLTVNPVATFSEKKILMIGDSTLAGDIEEIAPAMNTALSGGTLAYVGTQGTTYKHEGRSGFTFQTFATSVLSPFVKAGVLDIAAYFTDNSIDVPDIVYFRLGINDMYAQCNGELSDAEIETILGYADDLADGFLAVNPDAKIIFALPTICCTTSDAWQAAYAEAYDQDKYIEYIHRLWQKMVLRYHDGAYSSNVSVSFEAINVDRDEGYPKTGEIHTNPIHFDTSGNVQLGTGLAQYINDVCMFTMTMTSDGTGNGIAKMELVTNANITAVLYGDVAVYTNAGATEGESKVWSFLGTDASAVRYVKCTAGIAKMKFSDGTKLTGIGRTSASGWDSATNAPILAFDVSLIPDVTVIRCPGKNLLFGSISALTSLTYFYVGFANLITGDPGVNDVVNGLTMFYLGEGCRVSAYTGGATWTNCYVRLKANTGYGLDQTEIGNMLIDNNNSAGGSASNTIRFDAANASMADTTQGGIWGNFDGETTPSALATAYKNLIKVKGNTVTLNGIVVPGVSGDGTGFPAGFGNWYRS